MSKTRSKPGLADRLRPLAKQALERLKNDVPASYQEISTAHPYLPFFHRLESALKSVSNFDPEDDDVICIDDDDEIEEAKKRAASRPAVKRQSVSLDGPSTKRAKVSDDFTANAFDADDDHDDDDDDDDDSIVEVLARRSPMVAAAPKEAASLKDDDDWICPRCTMLNPADEVRCCMCDKTLSTGCDTEDEAEATAFHKTFAELESSKNFGDLESCASVGPPEGMWDPSASDSQLVTTIGGSPRILSPLITNNSVFCGADHMTPTEIAHRLEKLAVIFEIDQQDTIRPQISIANETFWDTRLQYACALRLFLEILQHRESHDLLAMVDDHELSQLGQRTYSSIIKHPLCFHDIIGALFNGIGEDSHGDGQLPTHSLGTWNMWRGMDLLQAIDLVFLNNLAYHGKERTKERSKTNKLRRTFWDGINGIIASHVGPDADKRRQVTPTRRGESSGFVVRK
jgi:hypothetical protein